jgi:hypothetical protein
VTLDSVRIGKAVLIEQGPEVRNDTPLAERSGVADYGRVRTTVGSKGVG